MRGRASLRRAALVIAGLSVCATWVACGSGASAPRTHTTWRDFMGSPDGSNYSSLSQIDRSNVDKLAVAWTYPTGDRLAYAMNPLVIETVMYMFAKNGAIVAVQADTGKEIWVHPMPAGASATRQRGLSYWESEDRSDRRLFIAWSHFLHAIDATTGKLITTFGKEGRVDMREGFGRDPLTVQRIQSGGPGRVFENLIIMGSATGEDYGDPPGDIRAYDVQTGKIVWTFHTIPRPGEFGYETWPKDAWKYVGGANNWGDMTLDVARGIVYIPTGSATYDFYGADRKGDNLFANSLLALDARTGKRIWHFQTVHHDIGDYDNVSAPQLITVQHGGKSVDAVAHAGKTGFLYVFHRVTGEPLWPIEERPVPRSTVPGEVDSPTQPFPTTPPPFARQKMTAADVNPHLPPAEQEKWRKFVEASRNDGLFTPPDLDRYTLQMPGHSGGSALFSTSGDPTTGTMYVVSFDGPAFLKLEKTNAETVTNVWHGALVSGLPGCEDFCPDRPAPRFGARARPTEAQLAAAKKGESVYQQHCAICHGRTLAGTGGAPSLRNIAVRLTDDGIRSIVKEGQGQMPAFSALSAQSTELLLAFLKHSPTATSAASSSAGSQYEEGSAPYPPDVEAPSQRYFSGWGFAPSIISPPWSTMTAYDLNTGTIKWQVPFGESLGIGPPGNDFGIMQFHSSKSTPAVTAGGLLFTASVDSKLRAFDRDTGRVLWSVNLPDRAMGIPAVYEVGGRQYVAIHTRGQYQAYALPR